MPGRTRQLRRSSTGSSFFVAFRVLPAERRDAIRAVYGFCRRADDAVDDADSSAAARRALERVVQELDEACAAAERPGAAGLARAIRRYGLPRRPFDDLIEGVGWDLEGRRYADREELREYCYRVASTVGLLCVRIFGSNDGTSDAYARELGVALQWTNILRDVGSDRARGRVYLPRASLRRHGLVEEQLDHPDRAARERIAALVREEAAYSRECFAAAERLLPEQERPKMLAAEIMGGVYRDLLRRVEIAGDGVLDHRVRVPDWRRGWIALRLLARRRSSSLRLASRGGAAGSS